MPERTPFMRKPHRLGTIVAALAAAAAAVLLITGPALADPPSGVTPKATDIVGVGADTTQYLFDQLSADYNKTVTSSSPHLYSWDATPAANIQEKSGSTACNLPRPNGSGAGISALESNVTDGTHFCVDFARSARSRSSTDPACASGGICYIYLAGDAVDWTARSTAAGGTDAPASLTLTQLKNIYLCKTTNWKAVGGKSATIKPFLPQTASGTRSFFLTALGGGTTPIVPGSCVSDGATTAFPNGTIQENEGQDSMLNNAAAIFPYSVADYLAQGYHDAACTSGCGGTVSDNPVCAPAGSENKFGCNETTTGPGASPVLTLKKINGVAATKPAVLPAEPTPPAINSTPKVNSSFTAAFQRHVYDVVRFGGSTTDPIPSYLQKVFNPASGSPKGWICGTTKGQGDIRAYGFLYQSALCGTPLNGTG
jgi:ABC-type phosphate transport system substrate-binding protein